jgi:roadblock/LC7 domain-containing protein
MPWKNRYVGNPVLTGILNLFFSTGIDDAHCGLRAIRREAFQALRLDSTGMEFASEMVIKASLKHMRIEQVPATLSPDLRDRAPHLRPWRDGWRHLRYLLMLSPTWAFGVPAAALMGAGMIILLVAALHMFGVVAGESYFGMSWTIVATFMLTAGHFAAIMALATHLYGVKAGFRRISPTLRRLEELLTLETALLGGGSLIALSAVALMGVGLWWGANDFVALPTVLPLLIGIVPGMIGLQTAFGGLMIAIITGHQPTFVTLHPAPRPVDLPVRNAA